MTKAPAAGAVPLRRWMSPLRGDHFYNVGPSEPDPRVYRSEGISCYVLDRPAEGAVPLYRLWRPRERVFATSPEAESLRAKGYRLEGVACYVYPDARPGTVPLYRFVDPHNGLHFYTTHPHAEFAK